ncbi:MAG: MBL fold metallo-hydrolase [Isosphaeraceae bacterium]
MRLTWYGHAAFLIETAGLRLIFDPYRSPDSGGYEPIAERADAVIVSHINDRYHSHLGQIVPPFEVVPAMLIPAGGRKVLGIPFQTLRVHETPERLVGDEVTIVTFESEGLKVVFLGDLGHPLDGDDVGKLVGADVVLVPAGGPPTLAIEEIPPLLQAIEARLILPMHYLTPRINLKLQPLETFLQAFPGTPVERPGRSWVEISRGKLPKEPTIVALDHAR